MQISEIVKQTAAPKRALPYLSCLSPSQQNPQNIKPEGANRFGYVPAEAVSLIADACNVSRADVHGVLTFYTDLRTSPPPDVPVRLCAAEACQSVGGRELKRDWERHCGESAELAEVTGVDEPVFCLGNCALAPAALVGGVLVGRATVEKVESMVGGSLQESP